ncbi:MAG: LLM class F420-dependent oxidoreductase [SAR202 cluster bacterium]|nr:LLM class F420-dependent oxidoreductase [SAR202 cluster bacterium]
MHIGAVFPHTEIGSDPMVIRDYAQALEDMGLAHLIAYDEMLQSDPDAVEVNDIMMYYTIKHTFHEPLVLFGYLAGVTKKLGFATSVLILTARQTGLVAKQAAEVDILSRGRLRLGIGLGWNTFAYRALGEAFNDRGKRSEEQIAVLRALWTQKAINFTGKWHEFTHLGINPTPVQRPIPIWLGGMASQVLERTGRLADGWFPDTTEPPDAAFEEKLARVREAARKAGREPKSIGVEGRLTAAKRTIDQLTAEAEAWRRLDASHISLDTMNAGLRSVDEHIKLLRRFAEATKDLRS